MNNGILFGGALLATVISSAAFAETPAAQAPAAPAAAAPAPATKAPATFVVPKVVSFKNDIMPIFHDYCVNCHMPGGKGHDKSGLDLRSYESLMKGTKYGAVIKPGDSFTSALVVGIEGRSSPGLKMPWGINGTLSKGYINTIKKWIDQGAKDN